jgi:hypothetical protein
VARQQLAAAPRRQAWPKGSPGAKKKSSPGVIFKNNFKKKLKLKNYP